jgi:sec-independent protein translocase protein TatA
MQQYQLAMLGMWELLLILAIVLVIFGAGKLPQLGDSLGKGIRNFRKSFKDGPKEVEGEAHRVDEKPPAELPPSAPSATIDAEAEKVEAPAEKS